MTTGNICISARGLEQMKVTSLSAVWCSAALSQICVFRQRQAPFSGVKGNKRECAGATTFVFVFVCWAGVFRF